MKEKQSDNSVIESRCAAVTENLKVIRNNIAAAAEKSGRKAEDIILLAATKTVPPEVINHAIREGVHYIGENKVQELCSKYDELSLENCSCEFIGHLQTNKVRQIVDKVDRIQSVDSLKLAKEIAKWSEKAGKKMDILVEVNIGKEENKSGVFAENVEEILLQISELKWLNIKGLMTIPPISQDIADVRVFFEEMYKKFIDIKDKKYDNINMDFLSMGMSADYAEAIECGANIVRIGSSLFGHRNYS